MFCCSGPACQSRPLQFPGIELFCTPTEWMYRPVVNVERLGQLRREGERPHGSKRSRLQPRLPKAREAHQTGVAAIMCVNVVPWSMRRALVWGMYCIDPSRRS